MALWDYYVNRARNVIDKWHHYFNIYERHFAPIKEKAAKEGRPLYFLEIGVFHGGSLQMWRDYFGPEAIIYGMDINPSAKKMEEEGFRIVIGDQADEEFIGKTFSGITFDIVLDDGGHKMKQQINSFNALYPLVREEGGVYLCEDTHTSYWKDYRDNEETFVEFCKKIVDYLTFSSPNRSELSYITNSISFYDSIVVIEKKVMNREPPHASQQGSITLF